MLLALSGIFALNYLPKATEPQVSFPGAYIGVGFEGVSPEDSERLLAKPLEDALRTISGVVDIRSTATTVQTKKLTTEILSMKHMVICGSTKMKH